MQVFAVLSLFLGYVSALPVYKAPMAMGGRSDNKDKGMGDGPGGTGGTGAIIPGSKPGGRGGGGPFGYSSSSAGGGGGSQTGGGGGGNGFISSSSSDYGGDTNPTPPTLPPGGDPTTASNAIPFRVKTGAVKGVGIVLALALVVGVCVGAGIYIIKKKG